MISTDYCKYLLKIIVIDFFHLTSIFWYQIEVEIDIIIINYPGITRSRRLVFLILYYFLLYSLIIIKTVVATTIINVYYSNNTDRTLGMVKKQM